MIIKFIINDIMKTSIFSSAIMAGVITFNIFQMPFIKYSNDPPDKNCELIYFHNSEKNVFLEFWSCEQ